VIVREGERDATSTLSRIEGWLQEGSGAARAASPLFPGKDRLVLHG